MLALILVLVACSGIMRCHRDSPEAVNTEDIRRFEAEIDSITITGTESHNDSISRHSKKSPRKRLPRQPRPKDAPARTPRPLEPIPQI